MKSPLIGIRFLMRAAISQSILRNDTLKITVVLLVLNLSSTTSYSLEPGRYATSYSLSQEQYVGLPSRKVKLPLYVYGNESGALSDFVPSGFMGDTTSIKSIATNYDPSAPASTGRTGKTTLRIDYKPLGRQGWAGIYWQTPANNWGKVKGAGFDLSQARYLSFWVRGKEGGESISVVKVGGIVGAYPDSDSVPMGPLKLTKEWKQFKMDLSGHDLRHIIGGFSFILRRADNPHGATIYFDEIVYLGDKDIDYVLGRPIVETSSGAVEANALDAVPKGPSMDAALKQAEPKTIIVQAPAPPPKIVYVEKPIYIEKLSQMPVTRWESYKPTEKDFLWELIRRAMEIQPTPYGYDLPLYLWARHLEKTVVGTEVPVVSEGSK